MNQHSITPTFRYSVSSAQNLRAEFSVEQQLRVGLFKTQ